MKLLNRLLFFFAKLLLPRWCVYDLVEHYKYIEREKERQIELEARKEMGQYLEIMGRDFQLDLERQDHVSYMLGNAYDQPKPLTLQELRDKKGR